MVIDPKTVDQTSLGEDPWDRDDFEDEEEDNQVQASDEDEDEDEVETGPEEESEQIIPLIQAVANDKEPRGRPLPRIQWQGTAVSASAACPAEGVASHPSPKGRGKGGASSVLCYSIKKHRWADEVGVIVLLTLAGAGGLGLLHQAAGMSDEVSDFEWFHQAGDVFFLQKATDLGLGDAGEGK